MDYVAIQRSGHGGFSMRLFQTQSLEIHNSRKRRGSVLFLLSLLITTITVYVFQPIKSEVSMPLFFTIFVVMAISNIVYFKTKKKRNYLDFDTIFILIFCLMGFSTTFFYGNTILFRALFLGTGVPVSDLFINRGNLLMLIGLLGYMVGSLSVREELKENIIRVHGVINTIFISMFSVFFMVLFIAFGGLSYFRNVYIGGNDMERGMIHHVLLLVICATIVLIATELYNKKILPSYKIGKFPVFATVIFVLLLLSVGNRTAASMIFVPFFCIYAMFFYNLSFRKFVLFMLLGVFTMWIVQNMRADVDIGLSHPIFLVLDLTIPARQTYTALEYVNDNGYTFGRSMLLGIVGVIPFLASFVTRGRDAEQFGSAEVLTIYSFEKNNLPELGIGLGTTIIADIYLSFGLFGVILLMFLLGRLISKLLLRSLSLSYNALIVLAAMLANCIFMVRASYAHPFRYAVWALMLALGNKLVMEYMKCKRS